MVLEPSGVEEVSSGSETGLSYREILSNFKNLFTYTTQNFFSFLNEKASSFFKKELFNEFSQALRESLKREEPLFSVERYYGFLKDLEKKIPRFSEIKHYRLGVSERRRYCLILTSDGEIKETERRYFRVMAIVVAERDGNLQRGYEAKGYTLSLEEAIQLDPNIHFLSQRAANLALLMLSARKVKAGVMPVILSGEAGGTMIHEAVGHGLEADHAEEGLSIYSEKRGEKVASPLITVIDDPTIPNLYGSYAIDDEGVPGERVVLIEKGILKNFLYDRYSALKYNKTSNGHGRREDFRHLPIPRMSNTFIAPGEDKVEDIINSIKEGILVRKMGGGEVNPLTGDFVFEVVEGYYIDRGEIAYPIKGATLVGNGPKVLESIDMISSDLHFEAGTCGKDGQGVPVSDGQPTLRIPELTVGGL
ncbi:MAG: TldD/PmbA family protein [Caldimicrobium sp.]